MKWVDDQLRSRGLPRRALAEHLGWTESKMSKVMNGDQTLKADDADEIRRFFGYRLPDDPIETEEQRILEQIARLGADQRRAVALYLEALMGSAQAHHQAS